MSNGPLTLARVAALPATGNVIPDGQRNGTLAKLAGAMRRVGMSQGEIQAALLKANADRCRPPLDPREVYRIAESIGRYEPDQISVALVENHWEQMIAGAKPPEFQFTAITSRELATNTYTLDYLVEGVLVRGQPTVIAGPKKTLKTNISIDLALALGHGGLFLTRLNVPNAVRVGVMSGESGAATIQETARRIALSKNWTLENFAGVFWSFDVPQLNNHKHVEALTRFPYETNPRLNDDAVEAVARSIREFGFRQPIVVDEDGVIIIGHTRLKAARKLGLTEVPVHVARGLSPEKIKALRIADNKTAEIAKWNLELLPIELAELQGMDFDLGLLGFDQDELAKLLDPGVQEGLTDPDEIPAPPDEAITKPGDLWILGEHRLFCGDSSKPVDLDRLLDGQPIHLCNTDPPYNVKVEPRSNNAIAAGLSSFQGTTHHQSMDVARHPEKSKPTQKKLRAKDRPLANDFVSDEEFDRLLDAWFGNIARVLVPGRGFYIWGGYANCANYPPFLKKHELYFSQAVIWVKEHPVLTRKDFMGNHEWCFYGWREGAAHVYLGPNNATDVWSVKKVNPQSMVHLTEKPVELAVRAMQYSSRAGENVLDLFGGSGSTLIAAEQTCRKAFLMELDPLYCDVIVQRFEKFTGRKAERVAQAQEPAA